MTRHHQAVLAALVVMLAAASRAVALQPTDQRRVDSLASEVRALRARVDSLRAQIGRTGGGGERGAAPVRPDTAAVDELASLRAAAAAAAGPDFGELNRWHLHALPETEYPLALRTFLGDDGLAGTGISLYRAFGGLGTHELAAQVTRSESDAELFGGSGRPTYLVHLLNFWQLTRSTYAQLGGTALYGTDPDSSLRTKVGGVDFRLTWRPPAQALYREWTLRGELYALRREYSGTGGTHLGSYPRTTYQLGPRSIAGPRDGYPEHPDSALITRQVIPSMTLWESEWVELRAQYTWSQIMGRAATSDFALQAVWAIGPHKHETY